MQNSINYLISFTLLLGITLKAQVHTFHNHTSSDCNIPFISNEQDDLAKNNMQEPIPNGVDVNLLESYPGAPNVIYLDFNGYTIPANSSWANGQPIVCAPSTNTDQDIYEAWQIVAEDYKPFNVNVTTVEAVFNAVTFDHRQRVVITPTKDWIDNSIGGIAGGPTFKNNDEPCFTFNQGGNGSGTTSSHEVGHTTSLGHDGRTIPQENYYAGHGNYAPIMGGGFKQYEVWSKGEYDNANNFQDDLEILTGSNSPLSYRTDDHGNSITQATSIVSDPNGNFMEINNNGIIETRTDVDVFSFTTNGNPFRIELKVAEPTNNLDPVIRILNSGNQEIEVYNPKNSFNILIENQLAAGTYYLEIDGVGLKNPATNGYSDYSSIGYYSLSGSLNTNNNITFNPTIHNLSPAPEDIVEANGLNTINISAQADDFDGIVSSVEFTISGVTYIPSKNGNQYSLSLPITSYGIKTTIIKATDNDGNVTLKTFDFELRNSCLNEIDKSNFTVISFTSEETANGPYQISNLMDDDINTSWSTAWDQMEKWPYEVQIDMQSSKDLTAMQLQFNNDFSFYFQPKNIEVYISNSTSNWGNPIYLSDLPTGNGVSKTYFPFGQTANGRYVKFVINSTIHVIDGAWAYISELDFFTEDCTNKIDPVINLLTPSNQEVFLMTSFEEIDFKMEVDNLESSLDAHYFTINNQIVQASLQAGKFAATWTPSSYGLYTYTATIVNEKGTFNSLPFTFEVKSPCTNKLNKQNWIPISYTSEETQNGNFLFTNLYDNDTSTSWSTNWDNNEQWPYEFQLDLGKSSDVNGISLFLSKDFPAMNWHWHAARNVEVFVSNSTLNWGTPVYNGDLNFGQTNFQELLFNEKEGRYLKFIINTVQNAPGAWAFISELEVYGDCDLTVSKQTLTPIDVKIFPNPTNGILNIHLGSNASGINKLVLIDVNGAVVRNHLTSQSKFTMDLKGLSAGTYFLRTTTANGVHMENITLLR